MPGRPTLSRLPAGQGFCSHVNQGHTFPQSPAVETEREHACKYHRAGPRPARVVTGTHVGMLWGRQQPSLSCVSLPSVFGFSVSVSLSLSLCVCVCVCV